MPNFIRLPMHRGIDVRDDRNARLLNRDACECFGQFLIGRFHDARVKRSGDGERDGLPTGRIGEFDGLRNGRLLAGNCEIAGAQIIRDRHLSDSRRLVTDGLDLVSFEHQQTGHARRSPV